jgi:histone arginine demethylase JMJD6
MFVPSGWWHGVLNLDMTLAITQNFCNYGNFDKVWKSLRKGRKRLSVNFLRNLKEPYPQLYQKAIAMNEAD